MLITIDRRPVSAAAGETVLQVARRAGIDIPTLCHREGVEPRTSCFLCAVRVEGMEGLQPACALPAREGMEVVTDSPEVLAARRTALELLFSDHAGRCAAPCAMACPAHLDIPRFLRRLGGGDEPGALDLVREALVLPSVLGRVCKAYCEGACLRGGVDAALSIRLLHRFVGDRAARTAPPAGEPAPARPRVAIVGAGPAGLAAAFHLARAGHACVLFDAAERPGGLLRSMPPALLDPAALDGDIAHVLARGVGFQGGWRLGIDGDLAFLLGRHDAVLVATGAPLDAPGKQRRVDREQAGALGFEVSKKGVAADPHTLATNLEGVFAAGEIVLGAANTVRCIAAGRAAAAAIGQFLERVPVTGELRPFYFSSPGDSREDQIRAIRALHATPDGPPARPEPGPDGGLASEQAPAEARRCMECACPKDADCRLRRCAAELGGLADVHGGPRTVVNPYHFSGEGRVLAPDLGHSEVVHEPGKCILCGLCLKIAEAGHEPLGLAFAGRGFPTRVAVSLGGGLSAGLVRTARACAEACPTGAFSLRATPPAE